MKFFFAFFWTETKSRSIKTQKKNKTNIRHLDGTSLVNKGFIIWRKIAPKSGQDRPMGSQSEHRICFILPTHGASHITKGDKQRWRAMGGGGGGRIYNILNEHCRFFIVLTILVQLTDMCCIYRPPSAACLLCCPLTLSHQR